MQVESDMGSIGCGHHHSVRPQSRCMPTCCDNAWSHLAETELLHGDRCRLVVVGVETARWDNGAPLCLFVQKVKKATYVALVGRCWMCALSSLSVPGSVFQKPLRSCKRCRSSMPVGCRVGRRASLFRSAARRSKIGGV